MMMNLKNFKLQPVNTVKQYRAGWHIRFGVSYGEKPYILLEAIRLDGRPYKGSKYQKDAYQIHTKSKNWLYGRGFASDLGIGNRYGCQLYRFNIRAWQAVSLLKREADLETAHAILSLSRQQEPK